MTIWENGWLAIKERLGYFYLHEKTRSGTVAVVPYHIDLGSNLWVLVRKEICPSHSENHELNCITGGIGHSYTPGMAAVESVLEEAGYAVNELDLNKVGWFYQSKMTDTKVHCFVVPIKDMDKKITPTGDGSELEKSGSCIWVSAHTLGFSDIKDISFAYIYTRLRLSRTFVGLD